jgi:hypothetical protein
MATEDDVSLQSVLNGPWPVLAVAIAIGGLLVWIVREVTQPLK